MNMASQAVTHHGALSAIMTIAPPSTMSTVSAMNASTQFLMSLILVILCLLLGDEEMDAVTALNSRVGIELVGYNLQLGRVLRHTVVS
jgi:hypothetical protein